MSCVPKKQLVPNRMTEDRWKLYCQALHVHRVQNMKSRIDVQPPKSDILNRKGRKISKKEHLKMENACKVHRENQMLLRKILNIESSRQVAAVSRTKPTKKGTRPFKPGSNQNPFLKQQLMQENSKILKRILDTKPTISVQKYKKLEKKRTKLLKNLAANSQNRACPILPQPITNPSPETNDSKYSKLDLNREEQASGTAVNAKKEDNQKQSPSNKRVTNIYGSSKKPSYSNVRFSPQPPRGLKHQRRSIRPSKLVKGKKKKKSKRKPVSNTMVFDEHAVKEKKKSVTPRECEPNINKEESMTFYLTDDDFENDVELDGEKLKDKADPGEQVNTTSENSAKFASSKESDTFSTEIQRDLSNSSFISSTYSNFENDSISATSNSGRVKEFEQGNPDETAQHEKDHVRDENVSIEKKQDDEKTPIHVIARQTNDGRENQDNKTLPIQVTDKKQSVVGESSSEAIDESQSNMKRGSISKSNIKQSYKQQAVVDGLGNKVDPSSHTEQRPAKKNSIQGDATNMQLELKSSVAKEEIEPVSDALNKEGGSSASISYFISSPTFGGMRQNYVFKNDHVGVGYYFDFKQHNSDMLLEYIPTAQFKILDDQVDVSKYIFHTGEFGEGFYST